MHSSATAELEAKASSSDAPAASPSPAPPSAQLPGSLPTRWRTDRFGEDVVLSNDNCTVGRSAYYGWATQLGDRWFTEADGVVTIHLRLDNIDATSGFFGFVGRAYEDEGWDEPLRDFKESYCVHGDGRMFGSGRQLTFVVPVSRIRSGSTVALTLDMVKRRLTVTAGDCEEYINGLAEEVALAVSFGGKNQVYSIVSGPAAGGGGDIDADAAKETSAEGTGSGGGHSGSGSGAPGGTDGMGAASVSASGRSVPEPDYAHAIQSNTC